MDKFKSHDLDKTVGAFFEFVKSIDLTNCSTGMDLGPENGSANVGLLRVSSCHGKAFRRCHGYVR